MNHNRKIVSAALFAACFLAAPSYADEAQDTMMAVAREAATYAGAARFCAVDEDLVDEFIAKAEARLRMMAKDDYERVLGQVEFKNIMTAASAKEPTGGCDAFIPRFEDAVKKAR
ncbi:MAG: hypothetical protein EP335_05900 [Alphaproteobacteria bacterium]|nr:MAG: hypothetical protein EP335_05900 [Alphaproteobacteria bacterium]